MKKHRITLAGTGFKHRELLEFKGVSYRYNKTQGMWQLVDPKEAEYFVPKEIVAGGDYWKVHGIQGATPQQALEMWFAGLLELREREAAEAEQRAVEFAAEVKRLKSASLKAPTARKAKKSVRRAKD